MPKEIKWLERGENTSEHDGNYLKKGMHPDRGIKHHFEELIEVLYKIKSVVSPVVGNLSFPLNPISMEEGSYFVRLTFVAWVTFRLSDLDYFRVIFCIPYILANKPEKNQSSNIVRHWSDYYCFNILQICSYTFFSH